MTSSSLGTDVVVGARTATAPLDRQVPKGHADHKDHGKIIKPFNTIGGEHIVWGQKIVRRANNARATEIVLRPKIVWGTNITCATKIVWGTKTVWTTKITWGAPIDGAKIVWGP